MVKPGTLVRWARRRVSEATAWGVEERERRVRADLLGRGAGVAEGAGRRGMSFRTVRWGECGWLGGWRRKTWEKEASASFLMVKWGVKLAVKVVKVVMGEVVYGRSGDRWEWSSGERQA